MLKRFAAVKGRTPLHVADMEEMVLYLISQGVDINAKDNDGTTPLHCASKQRGNVKKLKCLIAAGANVHVKDNTGKTPLHYAVVADVYRTHLEMVQDVMSQGADVHAKDNLGNTPLHIAATKIERYAPLRQVDVLKFLISSGADVHAKNDQGETPLDVAVSDENRDILRKAMTER